MVKIKRNIAVMLVVFASLTVTASSVACSRPGNTSGDADTSTTATVTSVYESDRSETARESTVVASKIENTDASDAQTTEQIPPSEEAYETTSTEPVISSDRLSEEELSGLLAQVFPDRAAEDIIRYKAAVLGDVSEAGRQEAEEYSANISEARKRKVSAYLEGMGYADEGICDDNSAYIRKALVDMINEFPAMDAVQEEAFLNEYESLKNSITAENQAVVFLACYFKSIGRPGRTLCVVVPTEDKTLYANVAWTDVNNCVIIDEYGPFEGCTEFGYGEIASSDIIDLLHANGSLRVTKLANLYGEMPDLPAGFIKPDEWGHGNIYPHHRAVWEMCYETWRIYRNYYGETCIGPCKLPE